MTLCSSKPCTRCRARQEQLQFLITFTGKPRPKYGLDCLICTMFARQRCADLTASAAYRGTSLIRNGPLLGPYSRTIPRVLKWSQGGGLFLMSEVPLYRCGPKRPRPAGHGQGCPGEPPILPGLPSRGGSGLGVTTEGNITEGRKVRERSGEMSVFLRDLLCLQGGGRG